MFKDKTLFGKKDEEHKTNSINTDSIAVTATATTSPATSFTTFSTNTNGNTTVILNTATTTTTATRIADLSDQQTKESKKNLSETNNQNLFSSSSSELSDLSDSDAETERMTFSQRQQTGYPLDSEGEFKSQLLQMTSSNNNIPRSNDLQPTASNTSSPLSNLSSERPNDRDGTIIVDHNLQNDESEFKPNNNSTSNIEVGADSDQPSIINGNKLESASEILRNEKEGNSLLDDAFKPTEQTINGNSHFTNPSPSKIKIDGETLVPSEIINSNEEPSFSNSNDERSTEQLYLVDNNDKNSNEKPDANNNGSDASTQNSSNELSVSRKGSNEAFSDQKNTDSYAGNGVLDQTVSINPSDVDSPTIKDSDRRTEEDVEMEDHAIKASIVASDLTVEATAEALEVKPTEEKNSVEQTHEQKAANSDNRNIPMVSTGLAESLKNSIDEQKHADMTAPEIEDARATDKDMELATFTDDGFKRKTPEPSDMINDLPNVKRQRIDFESGATIENGIINQQVKENSKIENIISNNKKQIETDNIDNIVVGDSNEDTITVNNEIKSDSKDDSETERSPSKADFNTLERSNNKDAEPISKLNMSNVEDKLDGESTLEVEKIKEMSEIKIKSLVDADEKEKNSINTLEKVNNNDLREEFQNEAEIGGDEDEDVEEDEDEEDEDLPKNVESFKKKVEGDETGKAVDEADQVDETQKQYELEQKKIKQAKEAIDKLTEIEIDFAKLKDKLYEDKLKTFEQEIQMCINGIHPTLKSLYSKIEEYRTEKLQQINNRKNYQLLNIDRCTRAKRAAIHQQHILEKNEIKFGILNDLTLKWYDINRDRKVMNSLTPEYSYRIPISDSDQSMQPLVDQLADVNDEIQILETISQKFGFPVASRLTSGTNEEILEDFTALGLL